MKYLLPTLLSLLFHLSGFGQCKFDVNTIIPVNSDFFVQGNVFGLVNNDLASPLQGVCGIEIEFEHEFIGNLQIDLIAPNGQKITLVGPQQIGNFTNGTEWNISMNPCADPVAPDAGFPNTWANGAPWTIGGTYTGSYYPYSGCLEDFNFGSANGVWQLQIQNGAFYTGLIKSFSIIFCDPAGISCLPCDSKAGTMAFNEINFCKNDPDLLSFIPGINFSDGMADALLYNYKYVIVSNGTILQITDTPDWSMFSVGLYEIYGISYLNNYEATIQSYVGDNFTNLNTLVLSTAICSELTPDSLAFTIKNFYDLPLKSIVICKNDTFILGPNEYTSSQLIRDTLTTDAGCDSIVNIDLTVADINVEILTDTIDCINKVVKLDTINFSSNISTYQILGYSWLDPSGNIISNNGSVDVTKGGDYKLEITALFGSLVCTFSFDAEVVEQIIVPEIPVILPVSPCDGLQSIFVLAVDTLRNDVFWTFEGSPEVILVNDTAFVTWSNPGNYQVCVFGTNQCGSSDTLCQTIVVNPAPDYSFDYDSLTCDGTFELNVTGATTMITWIGNNQEVSFVSTPDGSSINGFLLPAIDMTSINYSGSIGTCDINGFVNIGLIDPPIVTGIRDTAVCGSSDIVFNLTFSQEEAVLYYTWDAIKKSISLNSSGGLLMFHADQSGTLTLDSLVTPYRSCDILLPLNFKVVVNDPPFAVISDTVTLCNTFNENGLPKYFLDEFITSGDKSGTWNISSLPGVSIVNDSIDVSSLPVGNYTINYSTNTALLPCKEVNYKLVLKIIDCTCPVPAGISESLYDLSICNSYGTIDLDSLYQPLTNVSWFTVDVNANQIPLISHYYDLNSSAEIHQTIILKTIGDWYGQCPDSLILNLQVDQAKYAGDDKDLSYCIADKSKIGLDTILNNVKDAGTWIAFPLGFPGILQAFNPGARTLDISKLGGGELTMYSIVKSNNVCSNDTARLEILINLKPQIEITGSNYLDCERMETQLFLNGRNINDYSVSWEFNNIIFHNSTSIDSQVVNQPGTYNFYVENMVSGCLDTASFNVFNAPDSIGEVAYDVLADCEDKTGDLFINNVTGGSPPFSYSVDDGPFVSYTQFYSLDQGPYRIEILDSKNCKYNLLFDIPGTLGAALELGPDLHIVIGDSVHYDISFSQNLIDSIVISIDGLAIEGTDTSGILIPLKTQVFSVVIEDIFGCRHEDMFTIFVDKLEDIFVPNIFSPNDDGINDMLYIPRNPRISKILEFNIYDRWGNHLYGNKNFEAGEESIGWDGKFHGKEMDPAVFVYFVRYTTLDGSVQFKKGSFTLIR